MTASGSIVRARIGYRSAQTPHGRPLGSRGLRCTTAATRSRAFAIAAGVNAKALSTYRGHSGVSITLDRYGHLMPGNEADAAMLLDVYLANERTA